MPSLIMSPHEGGGGWPGGVGGIPPGPLGTQSLFGDGSAFGNITGVVSYSDGTWTVTGSATLDIDTITEAAVLMCKKLIVDGGTLTVSANCKGLIVFSSVSVELKNGGKINIDKLGKAGNFGNLTAYDLAPAAIQRKLKRSAIGQYVVFGEGAAGGAAIGATEGLVHGRTGSAATSMQTGGGGTGARWNNGSTVTVGAGGKGGPCCGGAASGGTGGTIGNAYSAVAAGPYGATGSDGRTNEGATYATGGGAGDPVGRTLYADTAVDTTNVATGAGGGLLMLFSPSVSVASGCIVSADGGVGGGAPGGTAGGSAGGGCVCIVTNTGGYSNTGTVRASGGASKSVTYGNGGAGGAGSVNIFSVS